MIPYGKHNIQQQDINAVVDVLENQFLTQGTQVPAFEQALCDYTGANYCTAVNSCTSGLHVACLALGIGAGDLVWTSVNSFAASANCARYCGADVDFVDIDAFSRNISLSKLEQKLEQAQSLNRLPKAIVVVHFSGESCDMQAISALCKPLNIAIIEDAAHALGASYQNAKVGSCQYSDMAVLSFHPVKSITTAEGGAIMCNDAQLASKCVLFAKHGITRNPDAMDLSHKDANEGDWYYQQVCLGYNYRLSDIQAALGISQLSRLPEFIAERRKVAKRYLAELADLPIKLPDANCLDTSSWHLFMIELTHHSRKQIFEAMHASGIAVNVHYIPIHWHPYYQSLGFSKGQFPVAEQYYSKAITLPIFPHLTEADQSKVINCLKQLLS